jgi:peptidoglycan/xylan/chitin deacetylase (PgdA/CDA1 family)
VTVNLLHSRRIFDYVSQHLVCSVPLSARQIALTFDDGPNPDATPRLLRLLDAHGTRATFFLVGRNVDRYPALAADIAARGHEIGNHTQNHLLLPVLPRTMMLREMDRAGRAIQAATGQVPTLFRPPMGWFSRGMLHVLAERGYRPVLGDVYPQDCQRPGSRVIARRVLDRVGPGSIVILHDGSTSGAANRRQSVDAVETILPRLRARGYEMTTVSQLISAAAREASAGAATGGASEAALPTA